MICCPAFCAIFHNPAPLPTTRIVLPTAHVDGRVTVTRDSLFVMYPLSADADCVVPVTSVQVKPPPDAEITPFSSTVNPVPNLPMADRCEVIYPPPLFWPKGYLFR